MEDFYVSKLPVGPVFSVMNFQENRADSESTSWPLGQKSILWSTFQSVEAPDGKNCRGF